MRILKLPAWMPNRLELERLRVPNYSDVKSFFVERADAVQRHSDLQVDIIMPKIYSVTKLPRLRSLPLWGKDIVRRESGDAWVGYYPYVLPRSRQRNWRHFGEKLFLDYVAKHGMPDVIWCAGVLWSAFLANHLHRKYQLPYFIVEHANRQIMDGGTQKSNRIKQDIIRLFREALFGGAPCSQTARRMQNFLGDDIDKIRIIPNVMSEEFEKVEINTRDISAKPFVLHNTARMDNNKNHAALIEAFAEFCKQAPDAVLNIVGAGPNREKIIQQIASLRLNGKVNLLGYMRRTQLAEQLIKSSAAITVSYTETFNNTVPEALACGLPCISTPAGVAEDAINTKNGIVVNSPSSGDILQGLRVVYERSATYDRHYIRRMALNHYSGAALAGCIKENIKNSATGTG